MPETNTQFDKLTSSRYSSQRITLYRFSYGENGESVEAYTDADSNVTFNNEVYTPLPLDRDAISSSALLDNTTLKINTSTVSPVVEVLRGYPPSYIIMLQIYQGEATDDTGDFRCVWSGRVMSAQRNDFQAEISAEPIITSMRRPGLRRNYQFNCPLALYGDMCKASKANATRTAIVGLVTDGNVVVLGGGWSTDDDLISNFVNGTLSWTDAKGLVNQRMILSISGENTLTLSGDSGSLAALQKVSVIKGCDHTMASCKNIHNNLLNFGGQPWIPTTNPFANVNNYT